MNYKIAFDRLTSAYIKNEVNPFKECACFVGNLLQNDKKWCYARVNYEGEESSWENLMNINVPISNIIKKRNLALDSIQIYADGFYTPEEIFELERCFMITYVKESGITLEGHKEEELKEDALFIAFEKTLDLLKVIHEDHGEEVDVLNYSFKKRVMA